MVLKSRQRNGLETGFVKKTSEEIQTSSFVWLTVRLSLDTRLRLSLRRLNSTVLQLISDWHSSLFLKRGPLISDRGRQNHFRAIDQLEWRLSVLFVQESKSAYILDLLARPPGSTMFTHMTHFNQTSQLKLSVLYTQHWLSVRLRRLLCGSSIHSLPL